MAAIFDPCNPASPSAYNASQTALLLLDLQGFCIDRCGQHVLSVLAKAKRMREWALAQKIVIIHSIVDVTARPPSTCKGAERIAKMLADISDDQSTAEEPPGIAFSRNEEEFLVLKHPGTVSGLKSRDAASLLAEKEIKSLVICGISTSGAVLRTALPATDDGFIATVIQDGCCDPSEELHETLVGKILPSRAHVARAEDFIGEWAKADS